MNKRTLSVILLSVFCLLAFVACNMDALDGIYSEISDSTANTNVNVRGIIGQDSSDHIYYLTDENICRIDSDGNNHTVLLSNSSKENIVCASADNSGNLLVLSKNKSTLKTTLSYYSWNGSSYDDPITVSEKCIGLLRNGLFFDDNTIYYYSAGSAASIKTDVNVIYHLETNEYGFFSVKEGNERKLYVIKNDGTSENLSGAPDANSNLAYVGFQPYSAGYLVIRYDSSTATFKAFPFDVHSGVSETALFTLKSSLPSAYSSQAATFCYTDSSSNEYIVVKATNYFDRYDVTNSTVENLSSGFATSLRTTDIVNIVESNTPGEFLVATYESFLFTIDPEADTFSRLTL